MSTLLEPNFFLHVFMPAAQILIKNYFGHARKGHGSKEQLKTMGVYKEVLLATYIFKERDGEVEMFDLCIDLVCNDAPASVVREVFHIYQVILRGFHA